MNGPTPPNLQNLLQKGYLKPAPAGAGAEVFFNRAKGSLQSARVKGLRSHDRFVIAYEGLFALAMGVLAHYQLRPGDKEGHRVTALQGALGVIGLAPQDLALVVWVHEQRNNKIYKMPLDASEAEADDATRLLATALEQAVAVTRK